MADPTQLSEVAGGYEVNRMVSFVGLNQTKLFKIIFSRTRGVALKSPQSESTL